MRAVLASLFLSLVVAACSASKAAPSPPTVTPAAHGPEWLDADLTGAQCEPRFVEPVSSSFRTFLCLTAGEVDTPHIKAGERHSPALFVRVPLADADKFKKAHPPRAELMSQAPGDLL